MGGINLGKNSMVPAGHPPTDHGNTHDVYVEVQGPSATDVHHNFVQRWNEASDHAEADGCWPDASSQTQLGFPREASPPTGPAAVQIQRTVRRGRYFDTEPTPGGDPFTIGDGEHSVLEQYIHAIDHARTSIYVEDQAIGSQEIVNRLDAALGRGVDVVFLVPVSPHNEMAAARRDPESKGFFESLGALGRHPSFTLAGIVSNVPGGGFQNVYVHAKIALIDDEWCTIGSANVGNRSFYGDTELNASIWHADSVRALRVELLLEHLGRDTTAMDDRAALALYREIARENAALLTKGQKLEGLAVALDPTRYGEAR